MVCGLLMVAGPGIGSEAPARQLSMLAVVAVAAGVIWRPAATLAVLLTVGVFVLSNPAATLTAVSGLAAAAYLVLRHVDSLDAVSAATLVGAAGFAFAGLVATAFPLQVPWLPLAAPLAVVAIYLLATGPFLGEGKS